MSDSDYFRLKRGTLGFVIFSGSGELTNLSS